MSHQECFAETVHRVPIPDEFFSHLVAPNGYFLSLVDGELACTSEANDAVLWQQNDTSFLHVESGESVRLARDTNDPQQFTLDVLPDRVFASDDASKTHFTVARGPARKPSEYLADLRKNGWVCLTQILTDDIVLELERTACTDRFKHLKYDWQQMAFCQNPAVAKTAAEPVSLWVTRQYMGLNEVRLSHVPAFAILSKDDGKRNVQGWHSDYPYHWGTRHQGSIPASTGNAVLGVQRNVCVSDFKKERGATAFKLGSHSLGVGPPEDWGPAWQHGKKNFRAENGLPYNGPEADIVEAPGGSIILYDSRTWHRAGVNRSDEKRSALLQAMTPMYVFPKNDTSAGYLKLKQTDFYDSLNERVKAELRGLMVHHFIGPGGRYAIHPDRELSSEVDQQVRGY